MSPYFTSPAGSPSRRPAQSSRTSPSKSPSKEQREACPYELGMPDTEWAPSTPAISTRQLSNSRINYVFELFKAGNLETAQIMAEDLLLHQSDLTVYHRAPLHSMLGLYPFGVNHAEKASQIYQELSLVRPEFREAYQNARVALATATKVEALWEAHEMKMLKRKTHTREQIRHDRYQLFYYSAFEHTRKDKIKEFLEATDPAGPVDPVDPVSQLATAQLATAPAADPVSQVLPDHIWPALLDPASQPSSEPASPPNTTRDSAESKEKSDGKSEIMEKKTAGSSKSRPVVSEKNNPYSYGVFDEMNNQTNGQTNDHATKDLHDRVVDHLIKRTSSNLSLGNMTGSPVYGLKSSEVYVRNILPRKSISKNSPPNNGAV
ncbi:hypothetical protein FPSE5266_01704 [Fusarium pseudograminearum]|nr:hypothetical protein FPSE5266_01704 [Fusarium pseudograminearum]